MKRENPWSSLRHTMEFRTVARAVAGGPWLAMMTERRVIHRPASFLANGSANNRRRQNDFSKREVTRRQAITAAALGTLAAGYPLSLRAAEPTAQEKANIQVVKDFCEAWPAHNVGKTMSYFGDNCAYRPLETMETAKGREAVENEIKRFVNNVERFDILETWARGPMVIKPEVFGGICGLVGRIWTERAPPPQQGDLTRRT